VHGTRCTPRERRRQELECLVCETDFGPLEEAITVYAGTDEYEAVTGGGEYPVWPHESLFCNGEALYVPADGTVDRRWVGNPGVPDLR
jgi:hypothetical protein